MNEEPKKWEHIPGVNYPDPEQNTESVTQEQPAISKPSEPMFHVEQSEPKQEVAVQSVAVATVPEVIPAKITEAVGEISVSAGTPSQMLSAQMNLIGWCRAKIRSLGTDQEDLAEAVAHAKKHKWKSAPLERQLRICEKRIEYYRKILAALEQGYFIVPNFECTVFAVRTDHKKPMAVINSDWSLRRQTADGTQPPIAIGEGEYKNAVPVLQKRHMKGRNSQGQEVEYENWWADSWDEFEFPLVMAKPELMNATTRAMALKIFDDIGITPKDGNDQSYSTVRMKGDPMILGRIFGPKLGYSQKHVSFVIGWHLSSADL